jgi:hypothetical protein
MVDCVDEWSTAFKYADLNKMQNWLTAVSSYPKMNLSFKIFQTHALRKPFLIVYVL